MNRDGLTETEQTVWALRAMGWKRRRIAAYLGLARASVSAYLWRSRREYGQ